MFLRTKTSHTPFPCSLIQSSAFCSIRASFNPSTSIPFLSNFFLNSLIVFTPVLLKRGPSPLGLTLPPSSLPYQPSCDSLSTRSLTRSMMMIECQLHNQEEHKVKSNHTHYQSSTLALKPSHSSSPSTTATTIYYRSNNIA